MRGFTATEREREMTDLAFLCSCENLSEKAPELYVDISQNPLRQAWGPVPVTITTATRLYSFRADRIVVPSELASMLGFPQLSWEGVSVSEAKGMVGDST